MEISNTCILVCDDPLDQAVFSLTLAEVSPRTICFGVQDPADALYFMAEESLIPDYMFVELNMPGMSAVEFLKMIKQIDDLRSISVIVHCVAADPAKVHELRKLGAHAIYTRPYKYKSLHNLLNLYFGNDMPILQPN